MRVRSLALLAAIVAHNLEEGIAVAMRPDALATTLQSVGIDIPVPPQPGIFAGLALFAIVPAFVLWRLARGPTTRLRFLGCMIAAMALANALVPHLALTLATQSYTPGAVSAVLVSLPLSFSYLVTAWRSNLMGRRAWTGAVVMGLVLLPLVLFGFWALEQLVREVSP